jgi:hypothetical protein
MSSASSGVVERNGHLAGGEQRGLKRTLRSAVGETAREAAARTRQTQRRAAIGSDVVSECRIRIEVRRCATSSAPLNCTRKSAAVLATRCS